MPWWTTSASSRSRRRGPSSTWSRPSASTTGCRPANSCSRSWPPAPATVSDASVGLADRHRADAALVDGHRVGAALDEQPRHHPGARPRPADGLTLGVGPGLALGRPAVGDGDAADLALVAQGLTVTVAGLAGGDHGHGEGAHLEGRDDALLVRAPDDGDAGERAGGAGGGGADSARGSPLGRGQLPGTEPGPGQSRQHQRRPPHRRHILPRLPRRAPLGDARYYLL